MNSVSSSSTDNVGTDGSGLFCTCAAPYLDQAAGHIRCNGCSLALSPPNTFLVQGMVREAAVGAIGSFGPKQVAVTEVVDAVAAISS